MRLSPQSLWRASLFLFLGQSIIHSGEARVLTEVPSGPLYRVRNYPLSISCNVSGFSNPTAQQDFSFSIYKSARPNSPIQIISTKDPDYAYAVYSSRVNNKDITVERVSPTSVLFKMNNLKDDEGEFECHVFNSESRYDGTYAGRTTVKVIDNSLAVSTPDTTPLSHNVGEAITLTCRASSNTFQHTHLSVTWSLLRDGEDHARPIISLDKDFTLSPGLGFEERYRSGLIGLEKVGEATYKLKMTQLEPSDQGNIYCEAQEWIQDPDRSWYAIAKEVTGAIALKVKPKDVAPSKGTLTVSIVVPQTSLLEGQEMSLSCNVDTRNLQERFFSVAWLRDSTELARIGPTGVLSVGPEYSGRESGGELRASRIGDTDQRLILRPVRTQDQGEYRCRAWPQDRGTDGTFIQGAAQDSTTQLVNIQATAASALSVEMQEKDVTVQEGDRLQLTCKVKGAKGQLSITWQHRSASARTISDVVSVNREGVTDLGSGFAQRSLKATRPAPDTFTLELSEVTPADGGVHLCTVSEWSTETDGTPQKTLSKSQSSNVSVSPAEALLKVTLSSRNNIVTVGEQTELLCRVNGPRLPVTVTWSLQREGASTPDNILTLSRDGDITWHGDQGRYQLQTFFTTNPKPVVQHTLLLVGASHREAGTYQCDVSVFLQGIHRKLPAFNRLMVMVKNPVSKLSLKASDPVVKGNVNTDIVIKCHIDQRTTDSSRFAVTWSVQHQTGSNNQTILSSDRDAVLTFGPQAQSGTWQRFSMKRSEGQILDLTIRQARVGDSGTYRCVVVEWLQDPRGEWYKLSSAHGAIDVEIVEPANDLRVNKTEIQLTAREAEEVDLSCTLTSGAANPSFRFTLTWFYMAPGAPGTKVPLVELDHSGLLTYPKNQELQSLQERLRLSRPAHTSFHLGIQRADEGDTGTYQCRVEQYQLNQEAWQQKASDDSGPITLSVKPIESKLAMLKEDVELNVTASQKFNVSCVITSWSSQSSAFQVTWFWQKETGSEKLPIYTSYRNSTLQGRSDKRERLRFDHPAPDRFDLTILGSVAADSGLYLCEVEEWLLSSSHGWRKVAVETSGEVTVTVDTGANDLRVNKTEIQLTAREAEEVDLSCTLTSGAANPSFRFTLTWFYMAPGAPGTKVPLVELDHSGLLTYPKNQELQSLQERLRLSRPAHTSFHLGIQRADEGDTGTYQCRVEQYQLNQEAWQQKASDDSGQITLSVKPIESKLSVLKEDVELNVTASQKFNVSCVITSRSSQSSAFQVTWFCQKETGSEKLPIYTSYRNSTLQDRSDKRERLRFDHPAPDRFDLTILGSVAADSGLYLCEVEEWLLSSSHGWRKVAVETSGEVTVTVGAGANDLRVNKTAMQLTAREAEEVDLSCTLTSGAANPSFRFTLTWFYMAPGAPGTKVPLVELDHSGLLTYPKNQELQSLQERIRLSRPAHTSFHLGIQRADEGDTGTYQCRVEQYQLNQEAWQQKASDDSGPMTLSVKPIENKLSMLKMDVELNVTASQKFNVSCVITSQSSQSSAFQVTWFWQKETGSEKLPIYTSYRNSTLQAKRERLSFDHPAPNHFDLTILGSVAADSGLYLCEVEEWLLSSSHSWKKVAVETSGEVTVTVGAGGLVAAGSGCPLSTIAGVLSFVIVCLLVAVVLMTLKIFRDHASGAKQRANSLWAEGHPLKTGTEDNLPPQPELDE